MAPPAAAVVALALAVRALPEVAVAPALLSQPPVLAHLPLLAVQSLLAVVVDLAERAVPVVPLAAEEQAEALLHLRSRRSFSAAMARSTT